MQASSQIGEEDRRPLHLLLQGLCWRDAGVQNDSSIRRKARRLAHNSPCVWKSIHRGQSRANKVVRIMKACFVGLLLPLTFAFGLRAPAAEGPEFDFRVLKRIADVAEKAGVKEVYFVMGGQAFSESGAPDAMVYQNGTATKVSAGLMKLKDSSEPLEIGFLELGVRGVTVIDASFKGIGIAEGFVTSKMYVNINPKHASTKAGVRLLFELWHLDAKRKDGYLIERMTASRK